MILQCSYADTIRYACTDDFDVSVECCEFSDHVYSMY